MFTFEHPDYQFVYTRLSIFANPIINFGESNQTRCLSPLAAPKLTASKRRQGWFQKVTPYEIPCAPELRDFRQEGPWGSSLFLVKQLADWIDLFLLKPPGSLKS